MTEGLTPRKQDNGSKTQFILKGFRQTRGIRIYTFEVSGDGRRTDCTVEVDLALIPRYGIRIQDLPLLCRELLQQQAQPDEKCAVVFTEQRMRSHAEKLAAARREAEHKKQPRHVASADAETAWRPHLR